MNNKFSLGIIETKLRSALSDIERLKADSTPLKINVQWAVDKATPKKGRPKTGPKMANLPIKRVPIKKAAKLLGIDQGKIYRMVEQDKLRAFGRPAVVSTRQALRVLKHRNS